MNEMKVGALLPSRFPNYDVLVFNKLYAPKCERLGLPWSLKEIDMSQRGQWKLSQRLPVPRDWKTFTGLEYQNQASKHVIANTRILVNRILTRKYDSLRSLLASVE